MIDDEDKTGLKNNFILEVPDFETVSYEGNNIKEKILAIVGAFAVTGMVLLISISSWNSQGIVDTARTSINKVKRSYSHKFVSDEKILNSPTKTNPYNSVNINGKAAVVYDINADKFLYRKNSKEVLPLASVTKLMTSLVVYENIDKDKNIAIGKYALETEGDSGLFLNETWNVKKLLDFTLLTSSNDGADALAVAIGSTFGNNFDKPYMAEDDFVKRMNKRAKEIGLENTKFSNATGLDEPSEGGLGTAEDVAKLLTFIWKRSPEILKMTTYSESTFLSEDGFLHHAENTNKYVNTIPGMLGSKTGYTDLAGGNLAIAYDAGMNHPVVVVVLGSSLEGRFADVKKLVDATYEYVDSGWYNHDIVAGSTQSEKVNM